MTTSRVRINLTGKTTQTSTEDAWPEGVIARYLTVAGATVDITEIERNERGGGVYVTAACCSGCPAAERFRWEDGFYESSSHWRSLTDEESLQRAGDKAREWAQSHAETCRALPRPTD